MSRPLQIAVCAVLAHAAWLAAQTRAAEVDRFPLTRDRFGTLGAPATKEHWDLLGARWFKSGDCFWQGGDWVRDSDRVQPWLLVRPRMFFTGNKPPDWAKPEVVNPQTFHKKIRAMRSFMKRAGLQDTALVITEMGVFNHCCQPRLSDARLIEIMQAAIQFMEGPQGVDQDLGMPSDGGHLVQKWSYSAFPHLVRDGKLTPMGRAYRAMVEKYGKAR